jgi:hypothetical protein
LTFSRGGTSRTSQPSEFGLRAGENEIEVEGAAIRFRAARGEFGGAQEDAVSQPEVILLI